MPTPSCYTPVAVEIGTTRDLLWNLQIWPQRPREPLALRCRRPRRSAAVLPVVPATEVAAVSVADTPVVVVVVVVVDNLAEAVGPVAVGIPVVVVDTDIENSFL